MAEFWILNELNIQNHSSAMPVTLFVWRQNEDL